MNSEKITQTDVTSRGITILTHFTKVENLPSILQHGLISRSELELNEHTFSHTDDLRLDGYTDGTCLSISFPNYKMFYPSRMKDQKIKWAVILLDASVLWEKDCAFFPSNAACSEYRLHPIETFKTINAFNRLFEEQEKQVITCSISGAVKIRETSKLPVSYPTNPQAEVICFDTIAPSYIRKIFFEDKASYEHIQQSNANIQCEIEPQAFFPRIDYGLW